MSTFYTASGQSFTLASSISSTQTSFTLSSFNIPVANTPITMATMNTSIAYGTLAPGTSAAELISFTGITQNSDGTATLTGVTRGLNKQYPYTESSSFKQPHAGQTIFILSDAPQVFNEYPAKRNDETITGRFQFPASGSASAAVLGTVYVAPTQSIEIASKGYVDSVAIAGAPDATTTVKGIGKVSVAPVSSTSPIFVGDNDTRVPTQGENDALVGNNTDIAVGSGNKFVTQTGLIHSAELFASDTSGSSTSFIIGLSPVPTSLTDGMVVHAKIGLANTTTTPTLNVNSLGAKTIVKGVSTALAVGDILAGQYCTFIYDLTNTRWVLQNPVSTNVANNPSYATGTTTYNLTTASGTQNIAHGLGKTPKYIALNWVAQISDSATLTNRFRGRGMYNGTTIASTNEGTTPGGGGSTSNYNTSTSSSAIILYSDGGGGTDRSQTAVPTFDATNIILTWTKSATSPAVTSVILITWEAFA